MKRAIFLLICLLLGAPVDAQGAPCGVVDAIDYPIDIRETLNERYDDFALFRRRFGGNHTGIDIAFNRRGETVYAAARGQVTYSDPEGWDTEKGVVIVRHVFPDNSIAYSLYGHMEESETQQFPNVGSCVNIGDPVGTVGWPSRGLPHLHYEIRDFLPDDGGPGYVTDNPLLEGWFHPLDFTLRWRLRLAGGYIDSMNFNTAPSLPPVLLDTGEVAIAVGDRIETYAGNGFTSWRVTMPDVITGIAGLPGGRVVAQAANGQAVTLQNGRYLGVWQVDGVDSPFHLIGETVVFANQDGGLSAYAPDGTLQWTHAGVGGGGMGATPVDFSRGSINGGQVSLSLRREDGAVEWSALDATGQVTSEMTFPRTPVAAAVPNGWVILAGTSLYRTTSGGVEQYGTVSPPPGLNARITADAMGNAYIYLNDSQSTLLAVDAAGGVRWRSYYPWQGSGVPPVLQVDNGCALYALDRDGALRIFDAQDGGLLAERRLYAGGNRNDSPAARLIQPLGANQVLVSAGFLSVYLLDANAMTGDALSSCLLG